MVIIIIGIIITFCLFAIVFTKANALHKSIEEIWRDDLEQEEYIKKWNEEHGKNKTNYEIK